MHYEFNFYSNQHTITDFFLTVSPYFATTEIFFNVLRACI